MCSETCDGSPRQNSIVSKELMYYLFARKTFPNLLKVNFPILIDYVPMHAWPVGESLNPLLHWHLKLPSIFMQIPLVHMPISLHSSWSVQTVPSGDTSNPGGHKHMKLPGVFVQRPFWHLPSRHSSISKTKSVKTRIKQVCFCFVLFAFAGFWRAVSVSRFADAVVSLNCVDALTTSANVRSQNAFVNCYETSRRHCVFIVYRYARVTFYKALSRTKMSMLLWKNKIHKNCTE